VTKRHELQAPKPDHRGEREWTFGVSHPEKNGGKMMLAHSGPLPDAPTVGVWSYEGSKPTSESMPRVLNLDGDVRRIHGGFYFGSGKRRPYVQRGGVLLYFLAPKCLRRGYKL
jgi:hypothetical protein